MNTLPKRLHSMRIIALPLARVNGSWDAKMKPHHDPNAKTMLVYYHLDLISPRGGREDLSWHKKMLKSVMDKAADLWTSLGRAPKGSWKLWTYELGERIAERIDFEESALRNIDPSVGPIAPLTGASEQVDGVSEHRRQLHSFSKIPFIYPPSLYPARRTVREDCGLDSPLAHMHALLKSRGPRHQRGFYLWMLIAPLTAPIALIPVMPNLPLFFCVWRSWSHYRAYRSSQYLSSLLYHGMIEPEPSLELDGLYTSFASSSGVSQDFPPSTSGPQEKGSIAGNSDMDRGSGDAVRPARVLLTHEAVPYILETLGLPASTITDIYRAIDQARGRLEVSSTSDI